MAKYKLKSKRATVKRFRGTASGKVKRGKTGSRHLLTGKSRNQKRRLRGSTTLAKPDAKLVLATVPYGLPK